jgi:hypothetical protein
MHVYRGLIIYDFIFISGHHRRPRNLYLQLFHPSRGCLPHFKLHEILRCHQTTHYVKDLYLVGRHWSAFREGEGVGVVEWQGSEEGGGAASGVGEGGGDRRGGQGGNDVRAVGGTGGDT